MKIGYPCINWNIDCTSGSTFRLKSYSEERLIKTVKNNLDCLLSMLKFNKDNNILFFRITSELIPFASHPVCTFNWREYFNPRFKEIGDFIKLNNIRISMHPDQFILLNSKDYKVFENSVKELEYHDEVLNLMKLDTTAKIQLHVGGVYNDKEKSIERFVNRYEKLHEKIKRRLVIENDERSYNLSDCFCINKETGVPILFDVYHHDINNSGETLLDAFEIFSNTWKKETDGLPMVDYSNENEEKGKPRHADRIDVEHFKQFLEVTKPFDFDIMLEIKDKEKSALKAVKIASSDSRFKKVN
jgi:UV DNA damage endonuclease